MLSLEDYLSIATSIVNFMRENGLQTFNASKGASFQRCGIIGVRTQGGTGRLPDTFRFVHAMHDSLKELDLEYHAYNLPKLREETRYIDPDHDKSVALFWFAKFHFLIQHARLTWQYKGGTCGGFSAIVVTLLTLLNVPCEEIGGNANRKVSDELLTHSFVVLGRKTNSDLRDITTWGNDFVIIDAWDNFKITHKNLIAQFPEDNLFFLPQYKNDWGWEIVLTIDKPNIIFKQHRALHLINTEYDRIMQLIPPDFRIFKPTMKFLFPDRAPSEIWYADKPIRQGGIPRKIKIADFIRLYQERMHDTFQYIETMVTADAEATQVRQYRGGYPLIDEIKTLLETPYTDNIVICFVSEQVGFAAYARVDIPAYSIVAIYAGEIFPKHQEEIRKGVYQLEIGNVKYPTGKIPHAIDARDYGGLARFFSHLPHAEIPYEAQQDSPYQRVRLARLIGGQDDYRPTETLVKELTTVSRQQFSAMIRDSHIDTTQHTSKADEIKIFKLSFTPFISQLAPDIREHFVYNLEHELPRFQEQALRNPRTWHLDSVKLLRPTEIATANLVSQHAVVDGVPVAFFYAARNINSGEILGFDYGASYWGRQKCLPLLFNKMGVPVSFENYSYTRIMLEPNQKNMHGTAQQELKNIGYYCTTDDYYKNLDNQLPIQIAFLQRPISFFALRDRFAENNLLPPRHKSIELAQQAFAMQLHQLMKRIDGVLIKAYYQHPVTSDPLQQHTVCVVCRFSSDIHWHNMAGFIKQHAISAFCKCYAMSAEIIFREVNIKTDLMLKFINDLAKIKSLTHFLSRPIPDNGNTNGLYLKIENGSFLCLADPTAY